MAHPSCYNRPPFKDLVTVQSGWLSAKAAGSFLSRAPLMIQIPHTMSKDCKQWGPEGEAKRRNWDCTGCRWKPKVDTWA